MQSPYALISPLHIHTCKLGSGCFLFVYYGYSIQHVRSVTPDRPSVFISMHHCSPDACTMPLSELGITGHFSQKQSAGPIQAVCLLSLLLLSDSGCILCFYGTSADFGPGTLSLLPLSSISGPYRVLISCICWPCIKF